MKNSKAAKTLSLRNEAKRWRKKILDGFQIDDDAGMLLLDSAMESFDEMRAAQAHIAEHGAVIVDRFKQLKQNPACLNLRDARTAMFRALRHLNLDVQPPGPIGRPGGR